MKTTTSISAALGATVPAAALAAVLTACSSSSAAASAMTAAQIAKAMHISGYVTYTAATDPNSLLGRQGEYTSKVNWGPDLRDSIEVFGNPADAKARLEYGSAFRRPFGDGYDYLDGDALLRLACAVTPAQAKADEQLFARVISEGTG